MDKFPKRRQVYGKKTATALSATNFFAQDTTPPVTLKRHNRGTLEDLSRALRNVNLNSSEQKERSHSARLRRGTREILGPENASPSPKESDEPCSSEDEAPLTSQAKSRIFRRAFHESDEEKDESCDGTLSSVKLSKMAKTKEGTLDILSFSKMITKDVKEEAAGINLEDTCSKLNLRSDKSIIPASKDVSSCTINDFNTEDLTDMVSNMSLSHSSLSRVQHRPIGRRTRAAKSTEVDSSIKLYEWLKPLTHAYDPDTSIREWKDILDPSWNLQKIAESSFAEVYKISNPQGTSILKIMALRPPSGPGSQRPTAIPVADVVSEVLIMDLMAEIPGFLEFKGAHIIRGKPPKAISTAFEKHAARKDKEGGEGSDFPKPRGYGKDQLFLALELGDAGVDLEGWAIVRESELWDIFLKTVITLTTGEVECRFEHRDLHEGNICLKRITTPMQLPSARLAHTHRLGYSGLEITLLDYTLSRAQPDYSDSPIFLDLEADSTLFASKEILQHQIYRRMRIWTLFRSHGVDHKYFQRPRTSNSGSWEDFMPYTNVLWLHFLLETVINRFEGKVAELESFKQETEDLSERLDPDRLISDGGFESAGEILEYCLSRGWIDDDDLIE